MVLIHEGIAGWPMAEAVVVECLSETGFVSVVGVTPDVLEALL